MEEVEQPTFKNFKDLTNLEFGKLRVIYYVGVVKGLRSWQCQCKCSKISIVSGSYLKSGRTRSCGCGVDEARYSHRMSKTKEHRIWMAIKERCYYEKYKQYKDYGGRGIKVCDRWLESFENFYEDMGSRPSDNHSIDRKDNDGNYCKENCEWKTKKEQANNTSSNIIITYNNKTQTLMQWSEELSLSYSALQLRLSRGWSIEKTLSTPIKNMNNKRKHNNYE